ncbi:Putative TRAP-type C4-dicarboxylate transport system, large permease component [Methyloversatilis universalis FAM5]|uniref:TRAP-type C4-dicarboxylate transport system, large permease component n=1 Tax=Methyloversatilis universalis (strain ATCC BAA-1314 / DSM 25237 / JCM 13912 / CCUG 52030 / FAM5) TaxID=1000565 RepID=F5RI69_METUF|nr:TRAP transporter large permease subunit [Methyloversatilis universalis]EGK70051.1 Putative TRAP-type C4-dicarboxylate transport system, large permease component [Methyloversatilis universalis FAM5]
MKKELRFGFGLMAIIIIATAILMPPPSEWTGGHLGLLMLALVVVAIMLGFPTAFTLMGMGVLFSWLAYRMQNPDIATQQTLDLMVQRAFSVMTNDVLISIPLFVFMGYLVERANLIEKLFKSLHLAMARIPGSLAVATLVTCAIFATATGIVGAVVTLMGLLALPAMLRSGYDVRLSAGVITAGGCLGILIPPSVMLIVYGATAGVSVVKLYAGAFFPGLMLAGLYMLYVVLVAKLKPEMAPPLPESERHVELPAAAKEVSGRYGHKAVPALLAALKGPRGNAGTGTLLGQLGIALLPLIVAAFALTSIHGALTAPKAVEELPAGIESFDSGMSTSDLAEPPADDGGLAEPPAEGSLQEPPKEGGDLAEPPGPAPAATEATAPAAEPAAAAAPAAEADATPAPKGFWIAVGVIVALLAVFYGLLSFERLEIFKMLLASFFPLAILILAVLGTIVFGLATPTEAAAIGAFGGALLAAAYGQLSMSVIKESVFLTAKTSAMVCWLFVGSAIFSAAFALLGGQELVEKFVLSMDLTPIQFMILAQFIIFVLGWPLEWTEIIVIFMPIFIPLLAHFNIDPLFFGLLVALNLQTAFLSPPVAMSAFYLKGVAPPHVTLNQIFAGMMPFMGIQVIALILLYMFPGIGMWLPNYLYN